MYKLIETLIQDIRFLARYENEVYFQKQRELFCVKHIFLFIDVNLLFQYTKEKNT